MSEVAKQIEYVITFEEVRKRMIQQGKENIKLFDWNLTAKKFKNIFVDVANKKFQMRIQHEEISIK